MRPLLKPIAAVLALSLVMPAYAASHAGKAASSKNTGSCYSKAQSTNEKNIAGNPTAQGAKGCWLDRISMNGDATIIVDRASPFDGDSSTFLQVQHLALGLDAVLASNVNAHVSLVYKSDNTSDLAGSLLDGGDTDANFDLDEAYFTWSDAAKSPLFAKIGKSFSSFGSYSNAYPVVTGMNQALVQANFTTAEVGFASNFGVDGSMFLFEDTTTSDWDKYGFRAGYKGAFQDVKYAVKLSYVSDYSAYSAGGTTLSSTDTVATANAKESAMNLDVNAEMKNVELGASYFAVAGDLDSATSKTRPKVMSFNGKYKMNAMGYHSNIHASLEKASDSGNVLGGSLAGTVKRLASIGFGMKLAANTVVGFDVFKTTNFAATNNDQTQYIMNASVRF
jgi:hypothetical protein